MPNDDYAEDYRRWRAHVAVTDAGGWQDAAVCSLVWGNTRICLRACKASLCCATPRPREFEATVAPSFFHLHKPHLLACDSASSDLQHCQLVHPLRAANLPVRPPFIDKFHRRSTPTS
ncbi:unnamed protein product [Cercospora beticola]|nr:unnamed protein product [Cercospora beticola]